MDKATEPFDLNIEISAGKKDFTVLHENGAYTLKESGSIVAVIKEKDKKWHISTGSYSDDDVEMIGRAIKEHEKI